jgi:predicted glycosyltransferase
LNKFLFVVQNGIGFGHLRRALVVAHALKEMGHSCFIVAQASSAELLRESEIPSLCIPSVALTPDNQLRTALIWLLEEVLGCFKPDVVIEDTYPLMALRSIPAMRWVRRVLLVRRVVPIALEEMRYHRELAWYDRILFMESASPENLARFGGPLRAIFDYSPRFLTVGPVIAVASSADVRAKLRKYRRMGRRLVVVNCGAGGEQGVHSDSAALFESAAHAASLLKCEGRKFLWVLVLGPYFKGPRPSSNEHFRIVDYEVNLPALLQAADITVLRPGFNATHEAMAGRSRVVLVPGQSHMEGQLAWARSMAQHPGVSVVTDRSGQGLANAIRSLPSNDSQRRVTFGTGQVVSGIIEVVKSSWKAREMLNGVHIVLLPDKVPASIVPVVPVSERRFKRGVSTLGERSFIEQGVSQLLWCQDVEHLMINFNDICRPAVVLVPELSGAACKIMADAYGAWGRGIVMHTVLEIVPEDLSCIERLISTRRGSRTQVLVLRANITEQLVSKLRRLAGLLSSKGIRLLTGHELAARLVEEKFLITGDKTA